MLPLVILLEKLGTLVHHNFFIKGRFRIKSMDALTIYTLTINVYICENSLGHAPFESQSEGCSGLWTSHFRCLNSSLLYICSSSKYLVIDTKIIFSFSLKCSNYSGSSSMPHFSLKSSITNIYLWHFLYH